MHLAGGPGRGKGTTWVEKSSDDREAPSRLPPEGGTAGSAGHLRCHGRPVSKRCRRWAVITGGPGTDAVRSSAARCRRGGDPDPVVRLDVVEEARQRGDAPRPADEAAVQADRQHLRRRSAALGVQHVEGVAQVGEELVPAVEALGGREAHVVGVERVRDDEVRLRRPTLHPVRQVVGVGVGVVEEAAVLDDESARVRAVAAGVPADRRRAGQLADRLDGRRMCSRSVASSTAW